MVAPSLGDEVKVTVIATGIDKEEDRPRVSSSRRTQPLEQAATRSQTESRPSASTMPSMPAVGGGAQDEWDRPAYVRRREAERSQPLLKASPPPLPEPAAAQPAPPAATRPPSSVLASAPPRTPGTPHRTRGHAPLPTTVTPTSVEASNVNVGLANARRAASED